MWSGTLPPSSRQSAPYPAHRLRREPEVRREHGLRDAPRNRGIHPQEFVVAFLGGRSERADQTCVLRSDMTLQAGAERGGIRCDVCDEAIVRWAIDQQELGVFDRV